MKLCKCRHIVLLFLAGIALASCDAPEAKYEKYLARGDAYYEKQDYIKARLEYKNAARILPADPRAIYSLGLVEEAEGNQQSALSAFWVAEQQAPHFKPVLLKLARFYLVVQQPDEAQARIDRILELEPDHIDARALKGSVLLTQKDFVKAQEEVDFVLKKDPSNKIASSVLAGIHVAQGHPDKALEVLERAVEFHPEEISYYLLKAAIYSEENNIDAVARVYRDIFALSPEQIRFRFDLARIFMEVGRKREAEKIYAETIQAFPDDMDAKRMLAAFLENEKGVETAAQEIHAFLRSDPGQKTFYLWLAELYLRHHQDARAVAALENIAKTDSDDQLDLDASTILAEIRLNEGDTELAKKLIETVLRKDKNNREILLLRAALSFSEGDYQKAAVDLRAVLRDAPGTLKASRMLAETLRIQGRNDLAIDTLLQAVQQNPGDKGSLVRLAQLYALVNNRDKALEILKAVTKADPAYPVGWETLARLAIESGQWEQAENAVAKLATLQGQQATAIFLQALIKEKTGQTAQAAGLYQDVINADPSSAPAAHALSALLAMAETPGQLVRVRDFLMRVEPQNAALLTVLGETEAALGHMDAAETAFRMAIVQNSRSQDPYVSLAAILVRQDAPEKALDILRKAEAAAPSEIKAPMMRAGLLIESNRIDEAIAVYEGILARNENADGAANNMAQVIADFKYNDEAALVRARQVAERFVGSDNPSYLDTLGWVYFRQGLMSQAQPVLAKAVSLLEKPNPQIDYHYGTLLFEIGQTEEAKTYLRRAVSGSQYPGFDKAQALLEKIK